MCNVFLRSSCFKHISQISCFTLIAPSPWPLQWAGGASAQWGLDIVWGGTLTLQLGPPGISLSLDTEALILLGADQLVGGAQHSQLPLQASGMESALHLVELDQSGAQHSLCSYVCLLGALVHTVTAVVHESVSVHTND